MRIKLDNGAKMPTRAHSTDAGLDLYCPDMGIGSFHIPPKGSVVIDTGVHIELPTIYAYPSDNLPIEAFKTVGFLKSKSGLNVNHGITSEGVIDFGYTGSIKVKLYNHSNDWYTIKEGDKISQLVILPVYLPTLELVTDLDETERGDNGFGSSGK
jgi:dUTP pyrophosphatase